MRSLSLILFALVASTAGAQPQACVADATRACLLEDRFQVEVEFDTLGASFVPATAGTSSGPAGVLVQGAFPSEDTAPFSF